MAVSLPAPLIGIVGGVGPYAGLDLAAKVFGQTRAQSDQEHLPLALLSLPHTIADRTAYLLGETPENPAFALAEVVRGLEALGATAIGIPCNTAHAPGIFDVLLAELARTGSRARVLHMIRETARLLAETQPGVRQVGVLSTTGTARAGVYPAILRPLGVVALAPADDVQSRVQAAIYDPAYGIKAQSSPVTPRARGELLAAAEHLRAAGAEAIILGCTEVSLALPERTLHGLPAVDPTLALARALIRETYPDRLKPLV
ncbi:MAG: Aspartate racemase [Chloroflexi bacterium ADurb.Bin325]|nr:MAG: Aspartate racemase [Chloroflexi bacterium ADurb.Bin325]